MGTFGKVVLVALLLHLGLVAAALARPVFLSGGGVVQAQSVWQEDGKVYVLVNRDSLVTFYAHEIDLKKTFDPKWSKPAQKAPVKVVKPAPAVVAPAASVVAPAAAVVPPPVPTVEQPAVAPAALTEKPFPVPVTGQPAPAPRTAVVAAKPAPAPRPAITTRPAVPPVAPEPDLVEVLLGALPLLLGGLLLLVVVLAGFWKIFVKAGQAGWKSLIPIYNLVVLLQIAGSPAWWVVLMLVPLVNVPITILVNIKLAKQFGKGLGFGLGLTFFGVIFFPLLGFGKATYAGEQGWTELPDMDFGDSDQAGNEPF